MENFTHLRSGDKASQTQAIGINNRRFPTSSASMASTQALMDLGRRIATSQTGNLYS